MQDGVVKYTFTSLMSQKSIRSFHAIRPGIVKAEIIASPF